MLNPKQILRFKIIIYKNFYFAQNFLTSNALHIVAVTWISNISIFS